MLQGTGSDVGKSLLAAGLGRAFVRRGLSVQPFKPQNMSNNACVTVDGGEIGRAQALQARACGLEPHSDMNPILLKPQTEVGSQIVVQGKVWGNARAREYQSLKAQLLPKVLESFERLKSRADIVIVEGAGSAAEVNLRRGDIANMGFAEATDTPVVLVGDIDRGGVIAAIVGTHQLLPEGEKNRIAGYIINKFRGDVSLFDDGLSIIQAHTGWPAMGVVPYFAELLGGLPAEDAMSVSSTAAQTSSTGAKATTVKIAIPLLARIANFDEFDPLLAEPDVAVDFIAPGRALPGDADLVILPGSKSTRDDLAFVREQGWDIDIQAHLRRGGWLVGICGGYQMLGHAISDPQGIEGAVGESSGLGLLDLVTELQGDKTLTKAEGFETLSKAAVFGYEMHVGMTTGQALATPWLQLNGCADGVISDDGKIMGCYLHGVFAADEFRHTFLSRIRQRHHSGLAYESEVNRILDQFADHLEQHLDFDRLQAIAQTHQ